MGLANPPEKAQLFAAFFSADTDVIEQGKEIFTGRFGPVSSSTGYFDFTFTDYYSDEMGSGLVKEIVSFDCIIDPYQAAEIKCISNSIEGDFSSAGKRKLNIDPGYISLSKVVLATTKNYSHRIYIDKGIYCEITLTWHKGTFTVNPWTYPDYADENIISFFNKAREALKKG